MNYCSLDDAFQTVGNLPVPGCNDVDGARHARKEERRKTRRSKVPPMTSLETNERGPDPDRQTPSLPEVEPFQRDGSDSFRIRPNSTTHENPYPPENVNYDKDRLNEFSRKEASRHYMVVPVSGHDIIAKKEFFGAQGPTDDNFADYTPDEKDYRLQPDFTKAFQQDGADRAGASPVLPPPSANMVWKPLTQSGAQTAFVEHLPPPSGKYHRSLRNAYENGEISMDDVMKKLDKLFAKLEDMNHSTPEQLTSELLMFISSGIFVLFVMDMMAKRG